MAKNLTDKQELFCTYYVSNGGKGSVAARTAGYSENSCREQSYELLRKPPVQDRIRQLMEQHFGTIAPDMADVLKQLALNARSELVRYNSAKDLLDRAGFKGVEKILNLGGPPYPPNFFQPIEDIITLHCSVKYAEGNGTWLPKKLKLEKDHF